MPGNFGVENVYAELLLGESMLLDSVGPLTDEAAALLPGKVWRDYGRVIDRNNLTSSLQSERRTEELALGKGTRGGSILIEILCRETVLTAEIIINIPHHLIRFETR